MKRLLLPSIILFITIINGYPQSSLRGFKNMEKGEFDKAIEHFTKHAAEEGEGFSANFGLSLAYSDSKNPNPDYFKAWDHYVLAKKYIDNLTQDENEFYKEFFTTRDPQRRSKPLRYNFDFEEKAIEEKLIKFVREENSIEAAEQFIKVYPNSKYYENVIHIRNQIKFRLAEKTNSLEAYNNFIKDYPDAAQVPKATRSRNMLAFDLVKKENTIQAYTSFIKNYPEADQYYEALKNRDQLAFNEAKSKNTIEAIEYFIKTYPKALQIMNAKTILRKLLYDKAKQVNTLEAYNDFILKYPEGEYFVDIFNLKSNVLGQNCTRSFDGATNAVVWIKGFDFGEKNDLAGGVVVTPDGKTIIAGNRQKTDEEGTQSWLIGVDNAGNVLWNKAYGSKTYNHANLINLTPSGEFIITGWSGEATDSLSRKAWIFKVAQNGNGLWEKTIEGNEVKDVILTQEEEIYLSGYQYDDSLRKKAFLLKLNSEAKKLWYRQYLKDGCLEGITMNMKKEIVCAAGRWVWKLDKQGYILWERTLSPEDSIIVPRYINTQLMLCGTQNNIPLIVKMNDLGNPAGELFWTATEPNKVINCLPLLNKRYLMLETPGNNKVKLRVIDDKGTELKSLTISNAQVSGPGALVVNPTGEAFVTFTSFLYDPNLGDICVMKLIF